MGGRMDGMAAEARAVGDQHFAAMEKQSQRLERIIDELAAAPSMIAVTDTETFNAKERGFPAGNARRWTIQRNTEGGIVTVTTTALEVLSANNRRLGGMIVNLGASAVTLYLATVGKVANNPAGIGTIWLPSGGGSWDFRLGQLVWCGTVSAIGAGNSSLSVCVL